MIESVAFQTRARTVDHLGREQIADCPTAISELWKNSYDAYARAVELHIFDGDNPVCAVVDDGHGMGRNDFLEKWLVVGTESKTSSDVTSAADRNGLRPRPRQGQKGIGRLSCANLGPLLLLISKRKDEEFIAALIDWRIFENPFLYLSDIRVPTTQFTKKELLFEELPNLFDHLMDNVWGGNESERKARVELAWAAYDKTFIQSSNGESIPPSKLIASTLVTTTFEERHIREWPVWDGRSDCGTALLISPINYDLRVQLEEAPADAAARAAKDKFFETLSSFVDPFADPHGFDVSERDPQFIYSVRAWSGNHSRTILGTGKEFTRSMVEPMEHIVEGAIDGDGVFTGRVKAFGEWRAESFAIEPPSDLVLSKRADSLVGPVDLFIASMEFTQQNTTHTFAEFHYFKGLAEKYAGFMIFRDGLRVMPYGRTDNDFFEIESRRSKSAGREFWNHRQMFGRLGISRKRNPNLKDKAGREGLLDNTAAKTLKVLVSNILMQLARNYFGSASEYRKELLPDIKDRNQKARAAEERNKLRKRRREQFRNNLAVYNQQLPNLIEEIEGVLASLDLSSEGRVEEAQRFAGSFRDRRAAFRLGEAPRSLGALEEPYDEYRRKAKHAQDLILSLESKVQSAVDRLKSIEPKKFVEGHISRSAQQIERKISEWQKAIEELQRGEFDRIRSLADRRKKLFTDETNSILGRVVTGQLELSDAVKLIDSISLKLHSDNEGIFQPYIGALESLHESIDLESVAVSSIEEIGELRQEIDRLNALAQLGITVEIIGHELEAYDEIIRTGLNRLPDDVKDTRAYKDIEFGCEGLTDQLRFLSPLKLSGQRIERWITGEEIFQYVSDFFASQMAGAKILLQSTAAFRSFRVYEQPSRLFPVFINLVNNSRYWLSLMDKSDRRILFDVIDDGVVISDSGPGVKEKDVPMLFSLFFTRKLRGGRGVGLYLCRTNLAAGGHRISYMTNPPVPPLLAGANFVIEFRGAEYAGQ